MREEADKAGESAVLRDRAKLSTDGRLIGHSIQLIRAVSLHARWPHNSPWLSRKAKREIRLLKICRCGAVLH